MNKKSKKPDLVVFNEETNQYDASLKPYGTSASSPVIKPLNTASWKNDGIQRVNKQLKSKFDEVKKEYGLQLLKNPQKIYHAIILTVAHNEFLNRELQPYLVEGGVIYDVKGVLDLNMIDKRL